MEQNSWSYFQELVSDRFRFEWLNYASKMPELIRKRLWVVSKINKHRTMSGCTTYTILVPKLGAMVSETEQVVE